MPTPEPNEDHDEFIKRCVPVVIDDGTAKDPTQAVAVCNSMWKQAKEALHHEADLTPRLSEAEGAAFEGREWDVTIIGPRQAGDLVTIDSAEYLRSKNGRMYNLVALRESAPAWEGVKVYDNHLTDEEFQERAGMRSVAREWIGTIVQPRWDAASKQLRGVLKIVEESVARKLKNAWDAKVLKTVGLSIDTLTVPGKEVAYEGRLFPTVEGFQNILSVDLVAEPAAGGGFNRLIAAQDIPQRAGQTQQEAVNMDPNEIRELIMTALKEVLPGAVTEALAEQRQGEAEQTPPPQAVVPEGTPAAEPSASPGAVPPAAEAPALTVEANVLDKVRQLECAFSLERKLNAAGLRPASRRLVEELFTGKVFKETELDNAIKRAREAQAEGDPSGRVSGAGASQVTVGMGLAQKAELEFMRIFMGNTAFRQVESIQEPFVKERVIESYGDWVKEGRPRDYGLVNIPEWMRTFYGDPFLGTPARASEAITTATMTSIIKNTVNLMLAANYAQRTRWWEPLVRTEEVDSIDQTTLVRVYGLNTLAVVDEGQAYSELTWADEEETASFVKKGNYVGVTLEQLLSDKLQVIRTLPARLSTSWYNTISELNSAVFTTNTATGPVLADTGALFNATAVTSAGGHANLLTTAFSDTAYGAARLAMQKQTDQVLGVGQKLLIRPKFILGAVDLESSFNRVFGSEMLPGSANNDINPYYKEAQPVIVPNWTDTNNWALVADPGEWPGIYNIFLRGRRVPEIVTAGDETSGAMFTNDTLRYKVRLMIFRYSSTYDCAPVADFRPLHKSNVT